MVIKIPRGKQPEITLPQTGALNVSAMNVISPVMNRLGGFLDSVSKEKQANDLRLENQRILNKVTKNKSLLADIGAEWIQKEVIEHDDVLTKENYDSLYKKFVKDQEKWMGTQFKNDPQALEMFQSEFYEVMTDVRGGIDYEKNQRILADSQINYDTHRQEVNDSITKLPSDENIWLARKILIIKEKNKFLESADAGLVIDLPERIAWLNFEIWKKAVSGGKERINLATGQQVVDYESVLQELSVTGKNKKTEWYGEPITEEIRARLIEYYQSQSQDQSLTENRYIKRTNDDLMSMNAPKVLDNTLKGGDIEILPFIGPDAVINKEKLMQLRKRVLLNQIPKEESIQAFRYINNGLIDDSINSIYQDFLVDGEIADLDNPNGWSIIDRLRIDKDATYGAVSDDNGLRFKNFLDQKYSNPEFLYNTRKFNNFLTRNNFEDVILGYMAAASPIPNHLAYERWQSTFILLQDTFDEEIKKGTPVNDLLNKDKDKYIWNLIGGLNSHIPTYELQTKELLESAAISQGTTVTKREYFMPPAINPRKYFTWEDWANSEEWQNWLNDKEKQKKYKEWKLKNK